MLFAIINGILFILSVVLLGLIDRNSKDVPPLRAKTQTKRGEEYRFFTDYGIALGILYAILCALIFLFHVYAGWTRRDWNQIIELLNASKDFYYFMAAISFGNGFLILPERSVVLERYQIHFGILTIVWLIWAGVVTMTYVNMSSVR